MLSGGTRVPEEEHRAPGSPGGRSERKSIPHLSYRRESRSLKWLSVAVEQREQAGLVKHADAQPLRLLELGAGRLAGHHVVGLLRHRRGHAAPRGLDALGRLLARQVGQRAGEYERLVAQRPVAERRALL